MHQKQLNIIYFVCHDLGKHLGCYGVPVDTPNLDRFAAEGVRFDNAFCASPCCSPSRGCAVTGKYAHNNGMIGLSHMGWGLPTEEQTVTDYFNAAGYDTIHIGYQHERFWRKNRFQFDGQQSWDDVWTENTIDQVVDFLQNRVGNDQPFYLNIGVQEVHMSAFTRDDRLAVYGGPVPAESVYLPPYVPDTPSLRKMMAKQVAAIQFMDRELGRLFEAIKRLGYDQNSVIVFTTDHGISGMRAKGTLYDRGVEIALMMQAPEGYAQGVVVKDLVNNIDLAPTMLEAAGVPIPSGMHGKSLWPLLTGKDYTPHGEIYMERNFHGEYRPNGETGPDGNPYFDKYDPVRSVRTQRFHYIKNFDSAAKKHWTPMDRPQLNESDEFRFIWPELGLPRDEEELYDVVNDPDEFYNLAYDPAYREVKEELARKLMNWMGETDDFLLSGKVPTPPGPYGWHD